MKKIIYSLVITLAVAIFQNTNAQDDFSCNSIPDCQQKIANVIQSLKESPININVNLADPRVQQLSTLNQQLDAFLSQNTALAFNSMVNASNKNEKLYEKTAQYLQRKYLSDSNITSNEILENIDFELDIYPKIVKKYTDNKNIIDYQSVNKELSILKNVFEKASNNAVSELRLALPNGNGILPGSKTKNGTEYAKEKLLPKLTNTLVVLALSVSTIMLIIGGIMYATSLGEDDGKTKAKNIIFYAVIGVVVSSLSYTIVKFVIGINFNIL